MYVCINEPPCVGRYWRQNHSSVVYKLSLAALLLHQVQNATRKQRSYRYMYNAVLPLST